MCGVILAAKPRRAKLCSGIRIVGQAACVAVYTDQIEPIWRVASKPPPKLNPLYTRKPIQSVCVNGASVFTIAKCI